MAVSLAHRGHPPRALGCALQAAKLAGVQQELAAEKETIWEARPPHQSGDQTGQSQNFARARARELSGSPAALLHPHTPQSLLTCTNTTPGPRKTDVCSHTTVPTPPAAANGTSGHCPQSSCGPQALREAVGAPPPKGEGGRRSYAVAQSQAEAHKAAATLQQAVRASKVAVPVATPVSNLSVAVPVGASPGDLITVQTPRGQYRVAVPPGVKEGARFEFALP